jgi:hypothetical protein
MSPRMAGCIAAARLAGVDEAEALKWWGTIRAGTIAQQVFR